MADLILEVRCPEPIQDALDTDRLDPATLQSEAQEALAVRWYAEHRLSLGKASELAGLSVVRFMELLRSLSLPVMQYEEEDLQEDLHAIRLLGQAANRVN